MIEKSANYKKQEQEEFVTTMFDKIYTDPLEVAKIVDYVIRETYAGHVEEIVPQKHYLHSDFNNMRNDISIFLKKDGSVKVSAKIDSVRSLEEEVRISSEDDY